jgi:hypothetical protein
LDDSVTTRHTTRWPRGVGLLALVLAGCSDSGTASRFFTVPPQVIPDYSTATRALESLAQGIEDKGVSNGSDVYLRAFADSTPTEIRDGRAYHAFFDPRDLHAFPGWDPSRDWNRSLEQVVYANLVRKSSAPYEMTWEPYEPAGNETGSADDSLLHRKYRIAQVLFGGQRSTIAVGAADLYFVRSVRDPGRWVIALWQDYRAVGIDSAGVTLGSRRLETQ